MKNQKTFLGFGSIGFRASSKLRGLSAALAVSAASLLAIGSLQAASLTWDPAADGSGSGGAGTWDNGTTANWFDGAADTTWTNANNDAAVFGGTGGAVSLDAGGITAGGLTFNIGGYTLSGGPLTLAGTTPNISVTTSGQSATISSQIAGTDGVTIGGAGTTIFNNLNNASGSDNTYSGGTIINGTLQVGTGNTTAAAGTYTTLGTDAVTVNSGGKLNMWTGAPQAGPIYTYANALNLNGGTLQSLDGTYKFTGDVVLTGTSDINAAYQGGKGITLSGGVSGSGGLNLGATSGTTSYGVSNIVMSGANTYLGTTTVTGVRVTLSSIGAGAITINNATNPGSLIFNSATPSTTLNQTISGNGQITQASNNTITLTGDNSGFTGSFAISGAAGGSTGTISYSTANNLGTGASAIVIGQNGLSSGILQYTGAGDTLNRGITLSGNGALDASGTGSAWNITGNLTDNSKGTHTLALTGSGLGQYSGNIDATVKGALSKTGAGMWTLTGTNTYSGGTTVNNGTLVTANTAALGTGDVSISGGALQVNDGTGNVALTGIGNLSITGGALDLATNSGGVTLASNKNFTMSLGSWALNNNSTTTGANIDQITLAPGAAYSLTGGTVDLSGFSANGTAGTYNIIGGTGSASGLAFTNGTVGYTYSIDNAGNLNVAAIPEPSTVALAMIFGIGMLFLFRRRRA